MSAADGAAGGARAVGLADLRLPVGTKLRLELVGRDYKRYPADGTLLGWRAHESVLVSLPRYAIPAPLADGMGVGVKLALQSGVVTFSSAIDQIANYPFDYVHLRWPASVQFEPLRARPRFACVEPLQGVGRSALEVITAHVAGQFCDISETGACVALNRQLSDVTAQLEISAQVKIAGLEQRLTIKSQIKRGLGKGEGNFPYRYGLSFVDLKPEQRLLLFAFCHQLQGNLPWSGG